MLNLDKDNHNAVTNKNCIGRLSHYKSALYHFKELGFTKIFSNYLAQAVGVTGSQIRKDFSIFRIFGNKRGGYSIDLLLSSLNNILSKNETHKVVIAGAGNLGSALINYQGFNQEGFRLIAAFDIDRSKVNHSDKVPVYPLVKLDDFVKNNNVEFGVIAVPAIVAQKVFEMMVAAGIKGVLNFAPCCLTTNDNSVFVNNVNLELELEQLVYFAKLKNKLMNFSKEDIGNEISSDSGNQINDSCFINESSRA